MQSLMEFWSIEKQRLIDRDVVQLWHHSIESTAFPISEVELCDARIQGTPLKDYYKVTILQSDHYNLWWSRFPNIQGMRRKCLPVSLAAPP